MKLELLESTLIVIIAIILPFTGLNKSAKANILQRTPTQTQIKYHICRKTGKAYMPIAHYHKKQAAEYEKQASKMKSSQQYADLYKEIQKHKSLPKDAGKETRITSCSARTTPSS